MAATIMQWTEGSITYDFDFDAIESEAPTHSVQITEYPIELGAPLVDFVRPEPVKLRLAAYVTNTPTREGLSHMDGYQPARAMQLRVRVQDPSAAKFDAVRVRVRTTKASLATNPTPTAMSAIPTSIAGFDLSVERMQTIQMSGQDTSRDRLQQITVRNYTERVQRVENIYAELQRAMYEAREFTVVSEVLGDFDRMLLSSIRTDRTASSGNGIKLDLELQQINYAELTTRDVRALIPKPKKKQSQPAKVVGKLDAQPSPQPPPKLRSLAKRVVD